MAKFSGPKSLLNGMYVKSYSHMKNPKTISKVNDEDLSRSSLALALTLSMLKKKAFGMFCGGFSSDTQYSLSTIKENKETTKQSCLSQV